MLCVREGERDGDDGPGRLNVTLFESTGCQRGEIERDARATICWLPFRRDQS